MLLPHRMDATPLVTCVIPTRDRPSLLRRALDSVLNQTYDNIEVIVVASPPHEPIRRVLEEYETENQRLKPFYISDEPDAKVGANVARNVGIREASGEYIAFLDDDDVWKPAKIQKQIPYLKYLDSFSIVSCSLTWVAKGGTFDIEPPDAAVNEMDIDTAFYYYSVLVPSCVVLKTTELRAVGGFDEAIRWGEMWDVSLKIMDRFDSCYMLDQHLIMHDRKHNHERMSEHEGTENLDQASEVYHRHKDKVQSRTARKTGVRIEYGYYQEMQDVSRYKHLFSGFRRDYELLFLRRILKNKVQKMWSHLKGG